MLTNTAIAALAIGKTLKDTLVPGLEAKRNANGVSFMLYYRTKTRVQRRPKIGDYPVLSIATARDIARDMLATVAAGRDPVAERRAAAIAPTVEELWGRCEREHYTGSKQWHKDAKRIYRTDIAPVLGKERVADLRYVDVSDLHAGMKDRPILANRALSVLSRMLRFAEKWEYRPLGSNPCQHVDRYPERKRSRYANDEEVAKIGPALELHALGDPAAAAVIYLLIFTGARPTEILRARPDQLVVLPDGNGILRLVEHKTADLDGEDRTVVVPQQAVAVLQQLPEGRKSLCGRSSMPRRFWAEVCKTAGVDGLWARDWRRRFASTALSNGVGAGQVGELLGHRSAQTTKTYAKLLETPAVKAAAATATTMAALLGRPPAPSPAPAVPGNPAPPSPDRQ